MRIRLLSVGSVLAGTVCLASVGIAQAGWFKVFGGPGDDVGYSVEQTTDGGYIVVGTTYSFGAGPSDVYLIKVSATGDTLWTRTYGGQSTEQGLSVEQTTDGGYIVAGNTGSFGAGNDDMYLVKTNAAGDTLWTRTYGETSMDVASCVRQTSDGGYVVVGSTDNFGVTVDHIYVVKTNASGDTLWTRVFGGGDGNAGRSVRQTRDGGYVIAGDNSSPGAGVYLIKTDSSGDTTWTRTYGGTYGDVGLCVQQTADDGYVIAGVNDSAGVKAYAYLIKTDAQGDTLWTKNYGGLRAIGYSAQPTTDGGYVVAGYNWPDSTSSGGVYLVKTGALGDTLWTRTYDGTYGVGFSVQQTSDGGYVIAGGGGGPEIRDVYLIKTDSLGNVGMEEPPTEHQAESSCLLVHPNPFSSFAQVPGRETEFFVLLDVTGRQVAICRGDRIGEGLRPGVYFLSPVGLRSGRAVTATIVKAAF